MSKKLTRTELARNRVLAKSSGEPLRFEKADPVPKTIPMRLPTIQEQLINFTRLGEVRRASMEDAADDFTRLSRQRRQEYLGDDDWEDDLDDLPREGLSPHEDPSSVYSDVYSKPLKKKDKLKLSSAKPKGEEAPAAKSQGAESPPPKAGA